MVTYSPGPPLNIAMPSKMYNTICLLTATCTLLWLMRAIKKFIATVRIRESIKNGRIVQVRGIGSYLSYFDEAVPSHAKYVM